MRTSFKGSSASKVLRGGSSVLYYSNKIPLIATFQWQMDLWWTADTIFFGVVDLLPLNNLSQGHMCYLCPLQKDRPFMRCRLGVIVINHDSQEFGRAANGTEWYVTVINEMPWELKRGTFGAVKVDEWDCVFTISIPYSSAFQGEVFSKFNDWIWRIWNVLDTQIVANWQFFIIHIGILLHKNRLLSGQTTND